jgi:hypothetical protein
MGTGWRASGKTVEGCGFAQFPLFGVARRAGSGAREPARPTLRTRDPPAARAQGGGGTAASGERRRRNLSLLIVGTKLQEYVPFIIILYIPLANSRNNATENSHVSQDPAALAFAVDDMFRLIIISRIRRCHYYINRSAHSLVGHGQCARAPAPAQVRGRSGAAGCSNRV